MATTSVNTSPLSPYFEWFRCDVIAAVPPEAKTVLSVGCAAGLTEAELVKRGMKVVGVEINPDAARIARERGVIVLEGDASTIDVNIGYEPYDYIIYADILEHLPDPVAVLKRHVQSLKTGGTVYVSVPNFRNYSVFWQLFVRGHICYKDAGILDNTHLRITTRKMVIEWFEQVEVKPIECHYGIWGRRNRLISACLFGLAREFIAAQAAVVGRKQGVNNPLLNK